MRGRAKAAIGPAILVAVTLAAAGCTSAAAKLQAWEGRPATEMVAARGRPDRIVSYPYGGRIYIWEEERTTTIAADAMGRRQSVGQNRAPQVYREMALVGENGVVVRTHTETGAKGAHPAAF